MFELGKTDHWWEIAKRYPVLSNHPNTLKPLGYAHAVNLIESFKPERVLEVGHGTMSFLFDIFSDKIEMWGLDDVVEGSFIYEEDFENLKVKFPNVTFVRDLLGKFSKKLPENYFDLVYSVSVIEHIPHELLPAVFEETRRILKPGGIVSHSYDVYFGQSTKAVFNAFEYSGFKWLKPRNTMNVFWEDWLGKFDDKNFYLELLEKLVFENPVEVAEKYMWEQDRENRNSPINYLTVLTAGIKPFSDIIPENTKDIKPASFADINEKNINLFTYSKKSFMEYACKKDYDMELYGKNIDTGNCDIKVYQNFLIHSFIKNNISAGAEILELGNFASPVLQYAEKNFDCSIMRLNENDSISDNSAILKSDDYLDNQELKDSSFDLIFSVSGFNQENSGDIKGYERKLENINKLLKPGGNVILTFILLYQDPLIWKPEILEYIFRNQTTLNEFVPMMKVLTDEDLFTMPEKYYSQSWEKHTGKRYSKFGKPLSYNVFWKK